jgi:hypothetical protein
MNFSYRKIRRKQNKTFHFKCPFTSPHTNIHHHQKQKHQYYPSVTSYPRKVSIPQFHIQLGLSATTFQYSTFSSDTPNKHRTTLHIEPQPLPFTSLPICYSPKWHLMPCCQASRKSGKWEPQISKEYTILHAFFVRYQQASSRTMNTVVPAASSAGAYVHIRVFMYILLCYKFTIYIW